MVKIQEIEVKSVMTKSNLPVADFSVNPYVGCLHGCKYCYASFMKRFTNHPEPWGEFIDVKYWPEIKNAKRYAGKEAFFGSVTDCYQPHEAKYKRTRALLEQLQDSGISVSIATKSDLVLRDLDLIKTFPHPVCRGVSTRSTSRFTVRWTWPSASNADWRPCVSSTRQALRPPASFLRYFLASPTWRPSSNGPRVSAI